MREVVIHIKTSSACSDNSSYPSEIVSIEAVEISEGMVIDEFNTKIKPEYVDRLSDCCSKETGLTYRQLENSPLISEVLQDFYKFIKNARVFSSGAFDKNIIINEINEKMGDKHYARLTKNAISSNHYNLVSYYNLLFDKKVHSTDDLAKRLKIRLKPGIERDVAMLTEMKRLLNRELSEVFRKHRLQEIISHINHIHGEHHKLSVADWGEGIIHESIESKDYKILSLDEFITKWSDAMIIDNLELNENYLSVAELRTLRKQVDFQRNLSVYIQG